jgi:sn-glycerol 3-phosphate transport system ATP-binding protein
MSEVILENVHKNFGTSEVLKNISLTIPDGSFTVMLGASGCGKSTLLRIIAGLERVSGGRVSIGGDDVSDVAPGERNVAMVFQNYALYPHLTVYQNIEYGLKARKVKKAERRILVDHAISMVRLQDQANKRPAQMSGGQRQRVALARAIVKRPRIFLMDEPLSNLDAKLRSEMRFELIELYNKLKTTFLYVTHDQVEAMSMGTNIVILDKGVVQQQGTPREIYATPENVFVAGFTGSPPANLINAGDFTFAVRPESIAMCPIHRPHISVYGLVVSGEHLGNQTIYGLATDFGLVYVCGENLWDNERRGETLYIPTDRISVFDKSGARIKGEAAREAALNMLRNRIAENGGAGRQIIA